MSGPLDGKRPAQSRDSTPTEGEYSNGEPNTDERLEQGHERKDRYHEFESYGDLIDYKHMKIYTSDSWDARTWTESPLRMIPNLQRRETVGWEMIWLHLNHPPYFMTFAEPRTLKHLQMVQPMEHSYEMKIDSGKSLERRLVGTENRQVRQNPPLLVVRKKCLFGGTTPRWTIDSRLLSLPIFKIIKVQGCLKP